jgi:hypothetical protein
VLGPLLIVPHGSSLCFFPCLWYPWCNNMLIPPPSDAPQIMQVNEAGVFLQLDLAPGPQGLELPRVYEPVTEVSPEPLPSIPMRCSCEVRHQPLHCVCADRPHEGRAWPAGSSSAWALRNKAAGMAFFAPRQDRDICTPS